jgi:hypothetical protein
MRRPLSDAEVFGGGLGAIAAMIVAGLLGAVRGEVSQANAALVLVLVVIRPGFDGCSSGWFSQAA